MYKGLLCLRHLSYSCLNEKIMSIVDLPALSPNCVSGYTRSDNDCNPLTATWAKAFPMILNKSINQSIELKWLSQLLDSPVVYIVGPIYK